MQVREREQNLSPSLLLRFLTQQRAEGFWARRRGLEVRNMADGPSIHLWCGPWLLRSRIASSDHERTAQNLHILFVLPLTRAIESNSEYRQSAQSSEELIGPRGTTRMLGIRFLST